MRTARSRALRHLTGSWGDASDMRVLIYVASLTCLLVLLILNVSVSSRTARTQQPSLSSADFPTAGLGSESVLPGSAKVEDVSLHSGSSGSAKVSVLEEGEQKDADPRPAEDAATATATAAADAEPQDAPISEPPPEPQPSRPPPAPERKINFSSDEKFLYYAPSNDWCKPIGHWQWSFTCALGEALRLNRTFVMDTQFCPWWTAEHFNPTKKYMERSPSAPAEFMGDFRLYYDWNTLTKKVPLVEKKHFFASLNKWDKKHAESKVQMRWIDELARVEDLKHDSTTLIMREIKNTAERYWYQVCHVNPVIERPWDAIWPSQALMDIVYAICDKLKWDYDAVHIVRRHIARNKHRWPHVDEDTSPPKLGETLQKLVPLDRRLYIVTDELREGFFDQLMHTWNEVYQLNDFKELWGEESAWRKEVSEQLGEFGRVTLFDDFMRNIVDGELTKLARRTIETFNDLTADPRDGVH